MFSRYEIVLKAGEVMPSRTFLWIEDRKDKAAYIFWNNFMRQLYPDITVESKNNNSELVKAVRSIDEICNRYIVVLDNSFDNLQVIMERHLLRQIADRKKNVVLLDIICFEYILLEFQELLSWIYAPNDEFLKKRADAIAAREMLVNSISSGVLNYKEIKEILKYDEHIDNHNIEQLAAKLLYSLTRNTGFEVSKGSIGDCWIKSCCEWGHRMNDDICGLDYHRLTVYEKMKRIHEGTSLKKKFLAAGLEEAL